MKDSSGPAIAQALTALLVSVSPNLVSMALAPPFYWYTDLVNFVANASGAIVLRLVLSVGWRVNAPLLPLTPNGLEERLRDGVDEMLRLEMEPESEAAEGLAVNPRSLAVGGV